MSSSKRRLLVAGLAGLAGTTLAGLGGCGFELRRPPRLSFSSITLTGFGERSPLAAELRKQLAQQVRVLQPPASVDVVLHAIDDLRERSVVASTAAAQVRELQLRVKFNFRAQTPGGRELIPRAVARPELHRNRRAGQGTGRGRAVPRNAERRGAPGVAAPGSRAGLKH
jgi:LPS-assembly lipoprotein